MEKEQKPLCYVIGPIGASDSEVRRDADMLYHSIIEEAVGDKYKLLRADKEHRSGMITNMIIQRVHDAEVVIADLTTLNPNAFYELGIRHAAKKPTIHVAQNDTPLPFDTAGYNTIFYEVGSWQSHVETRKALEKHLAEIEKPNYTPSNPVTQALTIQAFNASPDSEEKTIALLSRKIAQLERTVNSDISKSPHFGLGNSQNQNLKVSLGQDAIYEDIMMLNRYYDWELASQEARDMAKIIQHDSRLHEKFTGAARSSSLSKLIDIVEIAKQRLPY